MRGKRSIRRHLLLWLLPGFLALWAGAGYAFYASVRARYETELDAELRELLAAIPLGADSNRVGLVSFEDFARDDFGIYFQIWMADGGRLLKSENLGQFEMSFPESASSDPTYRDVLLLNQDVVRELTIRRDGGSLGPIKLAVAKTREEADLALRKLWLAVLGIGGLTGVGFVVLLSLALRNGLRPLAAVGEQASKIEPSTLGMRFASEGLPLELRPIAERLNDLMARLEQGFAREKRFGADLAHELRTPVAALKSTAEVALKWPEQASAEDYEDVLAISSELQTTIENLLTLARLEKAQDQLILEDVPIRAVIEDCWGLFAPRAKERGLVFVDRVSDSATTVTDPKLFRLIVSNLLSNAAEYAPEGSEIVVDVIDAILRVSNCAPQLSEDDLAQVFDRLWRHDTARTDSSHSGLGLSLAKTCAEVLEFELTAELEDGWVRFQIRKSSKSF